MTHYTRPYTPTPSLLDPGDVRERVRQWADGFASREEAGAVAGTTGSSVSDMISGRKAPTTRVLRLLGLRKRRVWVFEHDSRAAP